MNGRPYAAVKPRIQCQGPLPLQLDDEQLEAAARYASRRDGLNPDSITCAGRPQWQVYAQQLQSMFIPAINHALSTE